LRGDVYFKTLPVYPKAKIPLVFDIITKLIDVIGIILFGIPGFCLCSLLIVKNVQSHSGGNKYIFHFETHQKDDLELVGFEFKVILVTCIGLRGVE